MLRTVEASQPEDSRIHDVIEELAKLVEGLDETIALRRSLVESAIAAVAATDQKIELRSLARVLNRHGKELRARLDLVLNSLSRL